MRTNDSPQYSTYECCRQCGEQSVSDIGVLPVCSTFAGRLLDKPWSGGNLRRCRTCALVFRDPVAAEAEYETLYAQAPSTVWVSTRSRGDQALVSELVDRHSTGAMDVLDLGCYTGSLLQSLDGRIRKYGVEASTAAAAIAQSHGVEIIAGSMRDLDQVDRRFDVVIAVDVIEHVPNPNAFIERMLELSRPGGLVVISTGNADAWPWRLAGTAYWYTEFAEHISFISASWAKRCAVLQGVRLEFLRQFSYYDEAKPSRLRSRLAFCKAAFLFQVKQRIRRCSGRVAAPPPWLLGEPGLFADHFVFTLRKP